MDVLFLRKPAFSHSTILGFERCFLHLRNDEEAQWVWQKKFLGVISDGFVLPLIMTKQNITAPGKHVLSLDEASVRVKRPPYWKTLVQAIYIGY